MPMYMEKRLLHMLQTLHASKDHGTQGSSSYFYTGSFSLNYMKYMYWSIRLSEKAPVRSTFLKVLL